METERRATYRVQLTPDFTLDHAADLLDYLVDLGVSHLYCSPYLQAAPDSTHGYDVVNPAQVNAQLGGEKAHDHLIEAHHRSGVKQILDVVPNHMAIVAANPWWWDVLENGKSSPYAAYFDVDWHLHEVAHENIILLPILGDHYGRELEAGRIRLMLPEERFVLRVYEESLPVDPRTLGSVLTTAARIAESETLAFLAGAFARLPQADASDRESARQRSRDKEVLYGLLNRMRRESAEIEAIIQSVIGAINADPDALDRLIQLQNYRLAYWHLVEGEVGYRRFFDINSLIGLRMEDEVVFHDVHVRILPWLQEDWLDGVRIDHVDGLRRPESYLQRLAAAQPEAWVLVEKILSAHEDLPTSWPVAGTTGYDFMNRVTGLFVSPTGEQPLTDFYIRFTKVTENYVTIARESKLRAIDEVLGGDLNRIALLFGRVCARHRRYADYTRAQHRRIVAETTAGLPVYRTYVMPGAEGEPARARPEDVAYIERAVESAKTHTPELDAEVFDFLRDVLLLRVPGEEETELAMRFQQFTGSVTAKGIEDTAFYIYNRLVALNEVGGHPGNFGLSAPDFHAAMRHVQEAWPRTMLATSTHDTKRSEDVRARLAVLSEIPEAWAAAVERWSELTAGQPRDDGPSRNDEYLLYQTLVGAWPIEQERILQYMEKACREAMAHTSWTDPNEVYENAVTAFVKGLYENRAFITDLEAFVAGIITPGRINSLAQTLIKLTAPGVGDIYQGTELWDLSLADPDNRRPVDYGRRRAMLAELDTLTVEEILARMDDGLPKLWVIRQALQVRQTYPQTFGPNGSYQPLTVTGDHGLAFARGNRAVTVVPRLVTQADEAWLAAQVTLPPGTWRNVLTGEQVSGGVTQLGTLLEQFPVGLLVKAEVSGEAQ